MLEVPPHLSADITLPRSIDMTGKNVLISGGSEAIGRGISLKFAYHGARVYFNSRGEESATRLIADTKCLGTEATWIGGDLTERNTRDEIIRVMKGAGGINALVLNAGRTADNIALKMTDEEWDSVMALNFEANRDLTRASLVELRRRKPAYVVDISSVAAQGHAGQGNYASAKAALESYMRTIADEYGTKGIQTLIIRPGLVLGTNLTKELTEEQKAKIIDMTLTKQPTKIEDIADLSLYFASGRLESMTGATIDLAGGMPHF